MPELLKLQELSELSSNPPFWMGLVVNVQTGSDDVLLYLLIGECGKRESRLTFSMTILTLMMKMLQSRSWILWRSFEKLK